MVGVPQAIDIVPEFVTGRQLYNYISQHFKKTISNPITVGARKRCDAANGGQHDPFSASDASRAGASRVHALCVDPHDGACLLLVPGRRLHGKDELPDDFFRLALDEQRGRERGGEALVPCGAGQHGGRDDVGLREGGGHAFSHQPDVRLRAQAGGPCGYFLPGLPLAERLLGLQYNWDKHYRRFQTLLRDWQEYPKREFLHRDGLQLPNSLPETDLPLLAKY